MRAFRILLLSTLVLLLALAPACLAAGTGRPLPAFAARALDGSQVNLEDVVGKSPVLLVFWASWCPSCKEEAPRINGLVKSLGHRGMVVVGVNVAYNDSEARARAFIDRHGLSYPNVYDKDRKISALYRVMGVPTIIVADKSGRIVYRNSRLPDDPATAFGRLFSDGAAGK